MGSCVSCESCENPTEPTCVLITLKASFFLSVSVCRSSSPSCSSVSGLHQSKRLRHSQLVSHPPPNFPVPIMSPFKHPFLPDLCRAGGAAPCVALAAYYSKHTKVFPLLFGIVYLPLFPEGCKQPSISQKWIFIQFYDSPEVVSDSFSGSSAINSCIYKS